MRQDCCNSRLLTITSYHQMTPWVEMDPPLISSCPRIPTSLVSPTGSTGRSPLRQGLCRSALTLRDAHLAESVSIFILRGTSPAPVDTLVATPPPHLVAPPLLQVLISGTCCIQDLVTMTTNSKTSLLVR